MENFIFERPSLDVNHLAGSWESLPFPRSELGQIEHADEAGSAGAASPVVAVAELDRGEY